MFSPSLKPFLPKTRPTMLPSLLNRHLPGPRRAAQRRGHHLGAMPCGAHGAGPRWVQVRAGLGSEGPEACRVDGMSSDGRRRGRATTPCTRRRARRALGKLERGMWRWGGEAKLGRGALLEDGVLFEVRGLGGGRGRLGAARRAPGAVNGSCTRAALSARARVRAEGEAGAMRDWIRGGGGGAASESHLPRACPLPHNGHLCRNESAPLFGVAEKSVAQGRARPTRQGKVEKRA